MTPITLELPFPPSVNTYWRNVGRTILSENARQFRASSMREIALQIAGLRPRPFITWPVALVVILQPPDRRKRDLDNMVKAVLDAITHAKVWQDDSLVHDLRLRWGEIITGGKAVVTIKKLEAE